MTSQTRSFVRENAGPWAKVGRHVSHVDSTNAELQRCIAKKVLPEGYSIRADFQHSGRGRLGRRWESEVGQNLAVSYLLSDPGLGVGSLFSLSQNLALAVRDTVQGYLAESPETVHVKWPNDILIGKKKVGGILIETSMNATGLAYIVAGIGLNVRQQVFEEAPAATSLAHHLGLPPSVEQVWLRLTETVQERHQQLRSTLAETRDLYPLSQDYHTHLFGLNRSHIYERLKSEERFTARLLGVNAQGELRLDQHGEVTTHTMHDIRYVRELPVVK